MTINQLRKWASQLGISEDTDLNFRLNISDDFTVPYLIQNGDLILNLQCEFVKLIGPEPEGYQRFDDTTIHECIELAPINDMRKLIEIPFEHTQQYAAMIYYLSEAVLDPVRKGKIVTLEFNNPLLERSLLEVIADLCQTLQYEKSVKSDRLGTVVHIAKDTIVLHDPKTKTVVFKLDALFSKQKLKD